MAHSKTKLSSGDIEKSLKTLPGWAVDRDGDLYREFRFSDFSRAIGFMVSVATIAQELDHHPNWSNVYNKVNVRLNTHDVGGLTRLDFELAKRMNQFAEGDKESAADNG
jgi:4a-hydroxytetrahydrobiopterin dehydratase